MRSIRIIWIGKTRSYFAQEGIDLYLKKLSNYTKVEIEEVRPTKYISGKVDQWRHRETEKILDYLNPSELNIFLDEKGKRRTSIHLAGWFEKQIQFGWSRVNFIIGGAYGFEKSLIPSNANYLSLSDMTFTHQMVRLFLLEQLYRIFTIIRREPYHHV